MKFPRAILWLMLLLVVCQIEDCYGQNYRRYYFGRDGTGTGRYFGTVLWRAHSRGVNNGMNRVFGNIYRNIGSGGTNYPFYLTRNNVFGSSRATRNPYVGVRVLSFGRPTGVIDRDDDLNQILAGAGGLLSGANTIRNGRNTVGSGLQVGGVSNIIGLPNRNIQGGGAVIFPGTTNNNLLSTTLLGGLNNNGGVTRTNLLGGVGSNSVGSLNTNPGGINNNLLSNANTNLLGSANSNLINGNLGGLNNIPGANINLAGSTNTNLLGPVNTNVLGNQGLGSRSTNLLGNSFPARNNLLVGTTNNNVLNNRGNTVLVSTSNNLQGGLSAGIGNTIVRNVLPTGINNNNVALGTNTNLPAGTVISPGPIGGSTNRLGIGGTALSGAGTGVVPGAGISNLGAGSQTLQACSSKASDCFCALYVKACPSTVFNGVSYCCPSTPGGVIDISSGTCVCKPGPPSLG